MLQQKTQRPIVLNSKTTEPTEEQVVYRVSSHQDSDEDQPHESVPADSPESRPAHPELNSKSLVLLMFSVFAVVALASIVVYIFWGTAPAVLVFVFGTGIICLGNPEIWATTLRAKERHEDESSPEDGESHNPNEPSGVNDRHPPKQ